MKFTRQCRWTDSRVNGKDLMDISENTDTATALKSMTHFELGGTCEKKPALNQNADTVWIKNVLENTQKCGCEVCIARHWRVENSRVNRKERHCRSHKQPIYLKMRQNLHSLEGYKVLPNTQRRWISSLSDNEWGTFRLKVLASITETIGHLLICRSVCNVSWIHDRKCSKTCA